MRATERKCEDDMEDEDLIDVLPFALCVLDERLRIVRANELWTQFVGGGPGNSVLPVEIGGQLPEHVRDELVALCERVLRSSRPASAHEVTVAERLWDLEAVPKARGVLVVAIEVTSRAREAVEGHHLAQAAAERLTVAALEAREARDHEAAARAQAERRQEELDALFSSVTEPILAFGRDGRVEATNKAAVTFMGQDLTGLDCAEIAERFHLRRQNGDRIPPDELPASRSLRGEVVFRERVRNLGPHGDRVVLASSAPILQGDEVRGAVVVLTDVTELDRAEAALLESEQRFRDLADNIAQLAWMADGSGSTLWYNRRWSEYTGTTIEDMRGWGWEKVHHPDHRERVVEKVRRCFEAGEVWEDTFPLRGKDGEYRWFLSRAVPIRDETGKVVRWFGTNTDVTEQRANQEAVRTSEERLRLALDAARMVAWEFDPTTKRVTLTDKAKGLLALRGGQVHENSDEGFSLIHADDVDHHRALVTEAIENGGSYVSVYRQVRDGEVLWLEERGRAIADSSGNTVRLVGVTQNITERKRAEEALRVANERLVDADHRKNEFLAVLSHELRNPLSPIRNSVYILGRATPGGEQAKRAVSVIDRQVGHLARLIDDLLDVTRISRGKIRLQREPAELNEIMRALGEDFRELFTRNGIEFEIRVTDHPLRAVVDRTRIAQAVGNLLQNAAKFTPRGGHVRLSLDLRGHDAVIEVQDDGAGMPTELIRRLFEPFVQATQTIERSRGGLGLGLALVRGFVELHGGSVEAHSDGPSKGAAFTIRLPVQPELSAGVPMRTDKPPHDGAMRVLVIEDNVDAAMSLKEVLELGGHTADVALTGPEGIQKARDQAPDLILCDIGLPEMDGYGVASAMRADPRLRSTFLVALSGYALQEDIDRSKEAGFDRHVSKPPDIGALEQVLDAAAARARGGAAASGERPFWRWEPARSEGRPG